MALVGLVMMGTAVAGPVTIIKVAVPEPLAFVAVSVTNVVVALVGMPVMMPVTESRNRPGGRLKDE